MMIINYNKFFSIYFKSKTNFHKYDVTNDDINTQETDIDTLMDLASLNITPGNLLKVRN